MIRFLIFASSFLLVLSSCKNEESVSNSSMQAKGGKTYGGIFKLSIPTKPKTLFPYASISYYEQQLSSQLYETLFITDSAAEVRGNLAEKYELRDKGKTLRLYLKDNVLFHRSTSKLSSNDVLFSLAFACSKSTYNSYAYLLVDKLLGGQAFYAQTKENKIDLAKFKGVKIISNLVLDVFLTSPYAQLPKLLTHPNLVVLSYDDYLRNPTEFFNHAKGTGPFQLSTISEEKTVLSRNNTYWKTDEFGNKLPFLQSIEAFYSVNESLWFQEGKVDMIQNVSAEKINLLFGSLEDAQSGKNKPHRLFQLKNKNLNFLVYNTNFPPFNNEQNRIAVDRSIDKVAVCDEVLDGDGDACLMSFVPSNYYSSLIKENKKITSKPKFFTGEINLFMKNTTSELGRLWVKEVAKQIENKTTVKVKIIIGGDADFERMWNNGEIHLTKYNWVADYPDPDSYLGVFYSKSSVANQLRFYSRQFDDLYLETFKKETKEDCLNAQFSCDRFLIDHAFVSPIFLQDFIFVVNVNMRDFRISTSGQIDLSTVFYKPIQKLI